MENKQSPFGLPYFRDESDPGPTEVTCKECGTTSIYHTDFIEVVGKNNEFLGHIYSTFPLDDWKYIVGGDCPICNEWEYGVGTTCTTRGWGVSDPHFDEGHAVGNLIAAGWTVEDRDELQKEFNFSDFEVDAYIEAIKNYEKE